MTEDTKHPKPRLTLASAQPIAETAKDAAEPMFWLVWNPKRSAPQKRHATPEIARGEAQRLALESPGEQFYVLQAVSVTRMVNVETVELHAPANPPINPQQ